MSEETKWSSSNTVLILSVSAGAILWVVSPWLKGSAEPWGLGDIRYWCYLVGVGFITGAIAPRFYWASYFGVYIGQVAGSMISLPGDPLAPLGWFVALPLASLMALAGFGIGSAGRFVFRAAAAYLQGLRT